MAGMAALLPPAPHMLCCACQHSGLLGMASCPRAGTALFQHPCYHLLALGVGALLSCLRGHGQAGNALTLITVT